MAKELLDGRLVHWNANNSVAAPADGTGIHGSPHDHTQTCRHFRHVIPHEDADELRAADPHPCDLCDALARRQRIRHEVWNPKPPSQPPGTRRRAGFNVPPEVGRLLESCSHAISMKFARAVRSLL